MNQRQLYILMVLLMVLVLIMHRSNRIQTVVIQPYDTLLSINNPPELKPNKLNSKKELLQMGIALSGGGAKALCHVGVLKAFEEHHLKPDILAGVSAGAVVAALYADGYSPDSILTVVKNLNLIEVLRFDWPHGGLLSMNGFKTLLDTLLRAERFEDLHIPLKVVATDLDRGESVVFDKGPLVDALVATCSVPVLFNPYVINGVSYVDGGVLQNLPAYAIRPDCQVLVGVNTGPMKTGAYNHSLSTIALRSYSFIFRNNARYAKELCDWVIEPASINDYNGSDVFEYTKLFNLGYSEASSLLADKQTVKQLTDDR